MLRSASLRFLPDHHYQVTRISREKMNLEVSVDT